MQLPASLRALLGGLAADLDDPEVREILISGPGRAYVSRGPLRALSPEPISEARVRAIADRLLRMIEPANAGPFGDFLLQVIGAPRGSRCPIVQLTRRLAPDLTLHRLHERGGLEQSALSVLLGTAQNACGIVISGARGSGKTSLLAALAREWSQKRKLALLEGPGGSLQHAGLGHVVLDPKEGLKDAVLLGADAIAVDIPDASLWRELLVLGRPFIATIEAPDAQTALGRIVARVLAADGNASRTAAEAIVETSVDLVLEMIRDKDHLRLRAIAEPTRERGTLIARPVLAERRTNSFVAIGASAASSSSLSNTLGAAQVSPLGHSGVPTSPPIPSRSMRSRRKSALIEKGEEASESPLRAATPSLSSTPSPRETTPPVSLSPRETIPPSSLSPRAPTPPISSTPSPRETAPPSSFSPRATTPPLSSLSPRATTPLSSTPSPRETAPPSSLSPRATPPLSSLTPRGTTPPLSSLTPRGTTPPVPGQNTQPPVPPAPTYNIPAPAVTEPYATIDLEAPAAVAMDASPPIDPSSDHGFDVNELSEIRADHLVSKSFIYHMQTIDDVEGSQDVVAVDVPEALPTASEELLPEDVAMISAENMVSPSLLNSLESKNAMFEDPGDDVAPTGGNSIEELDRENEALQNMELEDVELVSSSFDPSELDSELGTELGGESEAEAVVPVVQGEIARARREAQERMPTVINKESSASALVSVADRTIQPDEWAAMELKRHTGRNELTFPERDADDARDANESGDLVSSGTGDLEPEDLMSGSLASSHVDEHALAVNDLDATQSAMVSEMVSSFPDPNSFDPDEDLGAFRTINPEANGEMLFPKRGAFDEITPVALGETLDPNRAAVVSDKEFDAMIDELRDVTSSSFGEEEEMTDDGATSRALPNKRAKLAQDSKKQRRLR